MQKENRHIPSLWDRWAKQIAYVITDEDDEPQECLLCKKEKSAGYSFPLPDDAEEFICKACWFELSLRLISMPDPDYFPGGKHYIATGKGAESQESYRIQYGAGDPEGTSPGGVSGDL
jgi:hypothetical protein